MADFLPAEAYALLDAISGPESKGKYNIRYGTKTFDGYDDHPRIGKRITSGPHKGDISTAAGRYQITETTWDTRIQPALHLPDFSPESQDKAAWWLAQDDYRKNGGGDLLEDLRGGDPDTLSRISKRLAGTWTSLPGGIEQGTSVNRFRTAYMNALKNRMVSPDVPPPPNRSNALKAISDALSIEPDPTTAYAPSAVSLTADALAPRANASTGLPAGIAAALRPRTALSPRPGTADSPEPLQAASVAPDTAVPVNSFEIARSPEVQTIRAREPWSLIQEWNLLHPKEDKEEMWRLPNGEIDLAHELSDYVEKGYVPTNQRPRENGLTTRTVRTVAIDPATGSVAGTGSLQDALNRVAERRRALLPGVPKMATTFADQGPPSVADPGGTNMVAFPYRPKTIEADSYPTLAADTGYPTIRASDPSDLLSPPTGPRGRGRHVLARPPEYPVGYAGSPVFGDNPALVKPEALAPSLVAENPPLPRRRPPTQPIVALDAPVPAPRPYGRGYNPVIPEGMNNPTAEEALAGVANGSIPSSPNAIVPPGVTSAFFDAINSPGVNTIAQMNAGRRPVLSFLARLFVGGERGNGVNSNLVNALTGGSEQPSRPPRGYYSSGVPYGGTLGGSYQDRANTITGREATGEYLVDGNGYRIYL